LSEVEVWLREFLAEFRKQHERLSEEEKSRISNLDDFAAPCQMLLLRFKDINFQNLVVTHDRGRNDAEITVCGPIPTYEAVDALDSILKDPKWDRELSEKEKSRYPLLADKTISFREVVEPTFLHMIHEIKNSPFVRPGPTVIGTKSWITIESFFWDIRGNMADLDPLKIVNEIMEGARKRTEAAKAETKPPSLPPAEPGIKGSGTHFYPPIWVGKLPKRTFKQKALDVPVFPERAFDTKYKEKAVMVYEDGLIALDEQDKLKATRMLNEIMATGLLLDLSFFAARELDVSEVEIDISTLIIRSFSGGMASLRMPQIYEVPFRGTTVSVDRREVEKEKLVRLMKEAERISQDPEIGDFLVLLLEAYTCLHSSEYMQSFMMSWVIIERHMFWLWEKFLREENITRTRREKLMNPAYWNVDSVLETLNLLGRLSPDDYSVLMAFKNKRNAVMHEGEKVIQNEADRCFQNAKRIVQQRSAIP